MAPKVIRIKDLVAHTKWAVEDAVKQRERAIRKGWISRKEATPPEWIAYTGLVMLLTIKEMKKLHIGHARAGMN